MSDEKRKLTIDGIELGGIAGIAKLDISSSEEGIAITWYEDWDNEAFSDNITIIFADNSFFHNYYCENNFTARSEIITDIKRSLAVLQRTMSHLHSDMPNHVEARELLDKAIGAISKNPRQ